MPSVTHWSRLEPRARDDDFAGSVRAEVRDPLWFYVRQWQTGEFQGTDSGSLVGVQLTVEHRPFTHFRPAEGTWEPFDSSVPLEARVEHQPAPIDLRVRVQAGLRFARHLRVERVPELLAPFLAAFPLPSDPAPPATVTDAATAAFMTAVTTRVVDGAALVEALDRGLDPAEPRHPDGSPLPPELHVRADARDAVRRAADGLATWFRASYPTVSEGEGCWVPASLEHRFSVSLGDPNAGGTVLSATEYRGGHLDWYDFDTSGRLPAGGWQQETVRSLPTQITFAGMPASRWWQFEDARIDFGQITAGPADLGRVVLAEFAMIHGDDWFLLPYPVPVGAAIAVRSLVVTDVFGQHYAIRPSATAGAPSGRWRMFALTPGTPSGEEPFLILPPVLGRSEEGPAVEEVVFFRDETASLAWGLERTLSSPTGEAVPGAEVAQAAGRAAPPEDVALPSADGRVLRYRLSSAMAGNWIPLIPVRTDSSERSIQWELAGLLDDREGRSHEPKGWILNPDGDPYRIHEEEISQEARVVRRAFQLARWVDGSTHLWIGCRVCPGRVEGVSGLRFDVLQPRPPE
jgi:hypothetical protein